MAFKDAYTNYDGKVVDGNNHVGPNTPQVRGLVHAKCGRISSRAPFMYFWAIGGDIH